MEENNEVVEQLREMFEKNKGLERQFAPFSAKVGDNMNVTISSQSGWSVIYPAFSEVWAVIISWLETWEEKDVRAIDNFIKGIVFPCSMRLTDIDAQYAQDIVDAHESLTERSMQKNKNEEENEDEGSDEH